MPGCQFNYSNATAKSNPFPRGWECLFVISIFIFYEGKLMKMIDYPGAGSVITAWWRAGFVDSYQITTLGFVSWITFLNFSPSSVLLLFPSLHLSFIIPPYIRPGSAVTEYRCRCQMDRWGLPWFSAKIQILAFFFFSSQTGRHPDTHNKTNTYYNWDCISQITLNDVEVTHLKVILLHDISACVTICKNPTAAKAHVHIMLLDLLGRTVPQH